MLMEKDLNFMPEIVPFERLDRVAKFIKRAFTMLPSETDLKTSNYIKPAAE